jgi:hypothetical protein
MRGLVRGHANLKVRGLPSHSARSVALNAGMPSLAITASALDTLSHELCVWNDANSIGIERTIQLGVLNPLRLERICLRLAAIQIALARKVKPL